MYAGGYMRYTTLFGQNQHRVKHDKAFAHMICIVQYSYIPIPIFGFHSGIGKTAHRPGYCNLVHVYDA